jgi:hypothetical protein
MKKDKNKLEIPNHKQLMVVLVENMGSERTEKIMQNSTSRYASLLDEWAHETNPVLRQHLTTMILPGVAFYRTLLEEGLPVDESIALIEEIFWQPMQKNRRFFEWMGRSRLFYKMIEKMTPGLMNRNFPPEGWDVVWVEVSPDAVAFNMQRCYLVTVMTEYGHPELVAPFCRLDDRLYDNVSPHVHWDRTMTIGTGGEVCDFRFTRVRSGRYRLILC